MRQKPEVAAKILKYNILRRNNEWVRVVDNENEIPEIKASIDAVDHLIRLLEESKYNYHCFKCFCGYYSWINETDKNNKKSYSKFFTVKYKRYLAYNLEAATPEQIALDFFNDISSYVCDKNNQVVLIYLPLTYGKIILQGEDNWLAAFDVAYLEE